MRSRNPHRPARRLALLALLVASCGAIPAPDPAPNGSGSSSTPPPAGALDTLRASRPRLLVDPEQLSGIAGTIRRDPDLSALYGELKQRLRELPKAPLPRYAGGDLEPGRIFDIAVGVSIAYRVEGDRRLLDLLWRHLEALASFPDWNPERFLTVAEVAAGVAIAYDWNWHEWTPEQRAILRQALVDKALRLGVDAYRGKTSQRVRFWVDKTHNWNPVCNSGLVLAALAVADDEPALSSEVLASALDSIRPAMAAYAPDGGLPEGPGYWRYGTDAAVRMMRALETALGHDFGLSSSPGFSETGWFGIHLTGPTGEMFNFADSFGGGLPSAPFMFWLGRRFDRPEFADYALNHVARRPVELTWLWRPPNAPADPALDRHFRGVGVVTLRGGWNDPNAFWVGFKAGVNGLNHSQLDQGTFVLEALGRRFARDLGKDDYGLPGYFDMRLGRRWAYYANRAEGHNTLVLGSGDRADQQPDAAAVIERFDSKPNRAFAIADLTPVYAGRARNVRRGIAMIDRRQVLVQDEIAADGIEVSWFLHTEADITFDATRRLARLSRDGRTLEARLVEPAAARFEIRPASPGAGSPTPPRQKDFPGVRKLTIHLEDVHATRIAVVFAEPGDRNREVVRPLQAW